MNDWKCVITLATCCIIILTVAPSASADFVGVTTAIKDDPDIDLLCTQGTGPNIPGPLTVCNVSAVFDNPDDMLLGVGNADLQVFNGANPDVFFHHPLNFSGSTAPSCINIDIFPDVICDTFITIGHKCGPTRGQPDGASPDGDFQVGPFDNEGHIVGGWSNGDPFSGQGNAGNYPDLQVLFLQSSVAQGLSLSGDIDFFWRETHQGDTVWEVDVPVECIATCGSCPTDVDGDGFTNAFDLAALLGKWGPVDAGDCQDADGNGLIDAFDLAVLLGAWGPCI